MRTLYVEVHTGQTREFEQVIRKKNKMGLKRMKSYEDIDLLKLEIPDNAKVTLQGMNPTNSHTGSSNPSVLRVYQGSDKKQIACIPSVIGFREDTVKVSKLGDKDGVVGKSWQEIGDNPIFGADADWSPVYHDECEVAEDDYSMNTPGFGVGP